MNLELLMDTLLFLASGAALAALLARLADWLEERWPWQDHWF